MTPNHITRALLGGVLASVLAGCGSSEFPRVDFPSKPGNYVQAYSDGYVNLVEIAVVDAAGKVTSAVGRAVGKDPLDQPFHRLMVEFEHCGLLTLTQPSLGVTQVASVNTPGDSQCEIEPLPVVWTRIAATPNG